MADAVEKRAVDTTATAAPQRSPYSGRFALAQILVVVAFAGVLVFFAFLVSHSNSGHGWSSFTPSGADDLNRSQSMANYVAPRYMFEGRPVAVVQAQPLIYRDVAVDGIAITQAPIRNIGTHYRQFEPADSTMLYVFCGRATKCGLPEAGASDIVPLLQRESLELALYTFKYSPSVKKIVNLLPPTSETSAAIYFKRGDLQKQLSDPLDKTLPQRSVVTAESMTAPERAKVEQLTSDRIYPSSFQQLANGRTLLLLGTSNGTPPEEQQP
jgi:hypothetical protein